MISSTIEKLAFFFNILSNSFFPYLFDFQFLFHHCFPYYNCFQAHIPQKLQRMFQTLTKLPPTSQQQPSIRFQAQSSICSQYIKLTSQKLYLNEATLFSQANELLQKIAQRQRVKDLSQWDVFSTRDSVILEDDGSFNLSNISVDSKSKFISRKNAMGSRTVRDFQGNINQAINEIEKTCSERTGGLIKKLAEEYKRMKNRTQDNEKKERNAKINQKLVEELREKQVIMTKRIEDLDETIAKLKEQNSLLKAQNKQLTESAYKKSNEIHSQKKIKLYEEIFNNKNVFNTPKKNNSMSLDIISKLVDEKEKIASQRLQEIRGIESKLEQILFKQDENTCEKCCFMLRKMKSSIIAYKSYLQKEGFEFQQMVDSFRSKILIHLKEN